MLNKKLVVKENLIRNKMKSKKSLYKKGSFMEDSKELEFGKLSVKAGIDKNPGVSAADRIAGAKMNSGNKKMMGGKMDYKKGGKSMKPGGGGRFAAMVKGLKKEGKSEDSAKAIAASIGRKKYGKSKFQAMAAAGKSKKQTGGPEDDKKSTRVGARADKVLGKAKANWTEAEAIRKFDKTEEKSNFAQDKFGRTASDKANQLYAKAERQENRAKRIKERSEFLKAAGKKMGGKKNC
jgi:hypothetical protein